jgi:hypothetical protein
MYILVSLIETPNFEHVPTDGKGAYEITLEVICNFIFALDLYMQVTGLQMTGIWALISRCVTDV